MVDEGFWGDPMVIGEERFRAVDRGLSDGREERGGRGPSAKALQRAKVVRPGRIEVPPYNRNGGGGRRAPAAVAYRRQRDQVREILGRAVGYVVLV